VRLGLLPPTPDTTYVTPTVALLVTGQLGNPNAVGIEARFEFLVSPPGGPIEPWFNVWLSGGVNVNFGAAPSAFAGLGLGGNVLARGFGGLAELFRLGTEGVSQALLYFPLALVASAAALTAGVSHFEVRYEAYGGGVESVRLMAGFGF